MTIDGLSEEDWALIFQSTLEPRRDSCAERLHELAAKRLETFKTRKEISDARP